MTATRVVKKAFLIVAFECKGAHLEEGGIGNVQREVTQEIPMDRMPEPGKQMDYEADIQMIAGQLIEETKAEALILLGTRVSYGFGPVGQVQ